MPVGSAAHTPRVRTRHGCWTCRKRRRKCDEKKPRCQNCSDKKRECQYGLQLAFLETNMLTLMPHEANDLGEHAPDRYHTLQFIDGMKEDSPGSARNIEIEEDQDTSSPAVPNESGRPASRAEAGSVDSIDSALSFQEDEPGAPTAAAGQFIGAVSISSGEISSHIEAEKATPSESFHEVGPEDVWSPNPPNDHRPQNPDPQQSAASWYVQTPSLTQHYEGESTYYKETLLGLDSKYSKQKLLKTFIDEVLPWLELSSPGSPYSAFLPMLSSKYTPLRVAILALAAFHSKDDTKYEVCSRTTQSVSEALVFSNQKEAVTSKSLLLIVQLLLQPFHSWRPLLANQMVALKGMTSANTPPSYQEAASWVLLRFDLGTSIITQQPLLTNLKNWPPIDSPSAIRNIKDAATTHLQTCLLLCAHISNLNFTDIDSSSSTSTSSCAETWLTLSTYLQNLANSDQYLTLSPLLNLHIDSIMPSTSTFPLQIHTTRLTFYASLLAHLSTLLLLQSRSRSISVMNNHHSPQNNLHNFNLKTPTWHALQICGLALSNNIHWSWDPVVFAALLCSGSLLSYRQQQEELMGFLRRLQTITEWDFDLQLRDLERVWEDMYL